MYAARSDQLAQVSFVPSFARGAAPSLWGFKLSLTKFGLGTSLTNNPVIELVQWPCCRTRPRNMKKQDQSDRADPASSSKSLRQSPPDSPSLEVRSRGRVTASNR
eukprot:13931372-Heterocapsa_arctica.AAC.1